MQRHAKEYLSQFANRSNTKDWLRFLVDKIIIGNGTISDADMNVVYSLLKNDSNGTIPAISSVTTQQNRLPLTLNSLKHSTGVCALQENTVIKFSPAITILYGLNGSGKSSYFKILNEIVGGNIHKEIIGDIYAESIKPIAIKLEYSYGGQERFHDCQDKVIRANNSLNYIRVFDSSYLDGLLDIRPTDQTVVVPYGLNLFSAITNRIDEIKQRITNEIDCFRLPQIDLSLIEQTLQDSFRQNAISNAQRCQIEAQYTYDPQIDSQIGTLKCRIKDITETDYGTRLVELTKIESALTALLHNAQTICKKYLSDISIVRDLLYSYQLLQVESDNIKSQTAILRSIGDTNSEEWKTFIISGEKFITATNLPQTICPYCRQPIIDDNVRDLLTAYSFFLNDKSEKALREVCQSIVNKIFEIEHTPININFPSEIGNIKEDKLDALKEKVTNLDCFIKSQYYVLVQMLKSKQLTEDMCDISIYIPPIRPIIDSYKVEKSTITELNNNKTRLIEELKEQLLPLQQHKYISTNQELFKKWFVDYDTLANLKKLSSKISTRAITQLSETAYNELITEQLILEFNNQLQAIGLKRHSVELNAANRKKGIVNMVIKVNGHSIRQILSEGELKAIGLALFVAECKLQHEPYPIIFDDPVNSLDHQIAANFANIIMSLDNQAIIFTHNRLFLDAFECSKENHICKQMDNGCNDSRGKHIYIYKIQDEGKSNKGVVIQHRKDCSKTYIKAATRKLNKSPFEESGGVASDLRNAIERIVDEVILNQQVPTRYSNKNSRIDWNGLSQLNPNSKIISALNTIHSRLSGGDLHNGTESSNNPITKDEFKEMVTLLDYIVINKSVPN